MLHWAHIERLRAHRRVLGLVCRQGTVFITRHIRGHVGASASRGDVAGLQLRLDLVRRYLQVLSNRVLGARPALALLLPMLRISILLVAHILHQPLVRMTVTIPLALSRRL